MTESSHHPPHVKSARSLEESKLDRDGHVRRGSFGDPIDNQTGNTQLQHHSCSIRTTSRVPAATSPPSFSRTHEVLFVTTVSCAQLLTQVGLSQSIAPLHLIGTTFGVTSPGQLSWLPAAYSLTVGTFILPAGRWGDLYGHKELLMIGYVWFAVWSTVAGFAAFSNSYVFLVFCRAMQGIGPAVLLPNSIAVLGRTYPPGPKKAMLMSIFGATAPMGFLLGAVFSGIFTQFVWWPWAYWVLGMVSALLGVMVVFVVPRTGLKTRQTSSAELDIMGTLLGVIGLILFNFAWNQGAVVGWKTVYVYLLLILGSALLALFFWHQKRWARFPLVPMSELTLVTRYVFGCEALGWASFGIWIFYLWQMFEVLRRQSILLSAAMFSAAVMSGCVAAIVTGLLVHRMQPGYLLLFSMTAFCVGNVLLATMPIDQTYWAQTFFSLVITAWGMDMSFPAGIIVLSDQMSLEHQGVAASLINTVVNYSISIGLGMAGLVETQVNPGGSNTLAGYRGAWYLGIGYGGLGVILAICLILSWRGGK